MKRLSLPFFLLLALGSVFWPHSAGSPGRQEDLSLLLPAVAEPGSWHPDGEPQVFRGEDLFVYIDGGADIYLEYGFVQVLVQDYRNAAGYGISLEIFQMSSEESAFGIYTFKTAPGGKESSLGDECRLADYYLNLWVGSLVVTITGLDQEKVTEKELLSFAGAVEAKAQRSAARPGLAGILPSEGLRPQSLKFFKGPLGLANADRLFAGSVTGFARGIKGDYVPGYTAILLEFGDAPEAAERFKQSLDFFTRNKKVNGFEARDGSFSATDDKGKAVCGERHGRFIILIAGAGSRDLAKEVIAGLAENLPQIS